jgi:hypothetical protein
MGKNKIDIIKVCLIIITIFMVANFLMAIYFDIKYAIRNHDEKKSFCDSKGEVYLKSVQGSNELINCCLVEEGEIIGCWEYLK